MRWTTIFMLLALGCASPTGPVPVADAPAAEVDGTAPVVEILTPERASFLDPGTVIVQGRVIDDGPVDVEIGGATFAVANDGLFRHTMEFPHGAHRLVVRATDAEGNQHSAVTSFVIGPTAAAEVPVVDALVAGMGPQVFELLSAAIERATEEALFDAPAATRDSDLRITGILYDSLTATIAPTHGAIGIRFDVRGLRVLWTTDRFGRSSGELFADRLEVGGELSVGLGAAGVVAEAGSPVVSASGWDLRIDGTLSFLEDWDWVQELTRVEVEGVLSESMRDALETVAGAVVDLGAEREAEGDAVLGSVEISPAGVHLGWNLILEPVAAPVHPTAPGPLVISRDRFAPEGLGVAVAIDGLNAALYAEWQRGEFRSETRIAARELALLIPTLATSDGGEEEITVRMELQLPPVFAPAEAGLDVVFADVALTALGATGEPTTVLTVGLEAPIELLSDGAGVRLVLGTPRGVGLSPHGAIPDSTVDILATFLDDALRELSGSATLTPPDFETLLPLGRLEPVLTSGHVGVQLMLR